MFLLSSAGPESQGSVAVEPPTCPGKGQDPAGHLETPEADPFAASEAKIRAARVLKFCSVPAILGGKDAHSVGERLNVTVEFGDALRDLQELRKP